MGVATLTSEISALAEGIKASDKAVAEATEQRKEENAAFTELMATNSAAKDLIGFAKNRLNKFYNPSLYVPPPEQELSEEDRIVVNFGGTAPPTPPEAVGPYTKKTEESGGVVAMMDMLIKDL